MSSCERPSKSSGRDFVPASVSKRYSFSTGTHGSSERLLASASLRRVSSFSSASSSSRAACHSSLVPIVWSAIGSPPSGRLESLLPVETPAIAGTERSIGSGKDVLFFSVMTVTETALARARAGDEDAFRQLTDPHRRELQLHCYRILGSVQDAEDLVQETLLAAWRGLEAFERRASVRAWLYRIATNRCLNALRARARRPQEVRAMVEPPEPTRRTEPIWLEPYPDALLEDIPDRSPGPEARYEAREAVGLAFISALQNLPPSQRAALVLRDVLGFRTADVASMLETGEAAVKGALQRARATLGGRLPAPDRDRAPLPNSARERELVGRFADAVESGDIDSVVTLLTDDALLTMPPQPLEYQGHE